MEIIALLIKLYTNRIWVQYRQILYPAKLDFGVSQLTFHLPNHENHPIVFAARLEVLQRMLA